MSKSEFLEELLMVPKIAEIVKYVLMFILGIIVLLTLIFGFGQYFIPLCLTGLVMFLLIVTESYKQMNPATMVLLVLAPFFTGYIVQKFTIAEELPMQTYTIPTEPTFYMALLFAAAIIIGIVFIFRCSLLGICKRK